MPANLTHTFPEFQQKQPLIFAHRGANRQALENTLPAFEIADALGADGIELDVQISSDGALVVYHDSRLSRLTTSNGEVCSLPLNKLQSLELGIQLGTRYLRSQIPTLDEVFEHFATRMLFNVELKPVARLREILAKQVAVCIQRHRLEERVVVSSFDARSLRILRRCNPTLQIGQLVINPYMLRLPLPQWVYSINLGLAHAIHPNYGFLDQEVVRKAHQIGLQVNVWTVNSPDEIQRMIEYGVDMIITDVPDMARNTVDARMPTE